MTTHIAFSKLLLSDAASTGRVILANFSLFLSLVSILHLSIAAQTEENVVLAPARLLLRLVPTM